MAETATSPAPAADKADKQANVRPPKPDENLFKQELAKAEKEHKASMDRLAAVKAKIEIAMPNKNKDQPNPTQKRRQELIAQANEIRQKQAGGKNARSTKLDQIKRLDEQVRSRINEQKAAKSKVPFKSLEDLDRQIASLDKQVNSGTMKLVDEKKALSDISSLRKMRKSFGQLDDSQKQIDDLRAKSLLQFLDPNHKVEKGPLMADTGLGAQAQRSVDESGLKGTKLLRKEDRDEEYAPAVKKGKKGKKTAHGGSSNKFNVPPAVVEDCAAMGIDPPMSAADIPAVAEKVRAKLDFWKNDQEAQTQRNIEKAKKEIAELEAAEANGDKVEQTSADLKETSIADKQES
ncbi:hypothetical protein DER46DRAFT_291229 [Fusarium sp. MPI-SDFR-AT-0072]|nr:hypothetical protein DER46DRAFT_291229 [Fusarium sp. MPI-SDFR-AT-0072]